MRRLFTGLMAVIAFAPVAHAAPSLEFSIGVCAAKTNVKARLACYDAIAAQLRAGEASAAVAAPVPPAPVAPAAAVPAPTPYAAAPTPVPAPVAAAPTPAVAAPAAPVAAAAAPASVATSQQQQEAQFGAEDIKKSARNADGQPDSVEAISGVIKQCAYSPLGRAILTLDNGQVWRQIDGDTDHFRGKAGDVAHIERSSVGGYNLTTEGHTQMVKVQRVR